MPKLTEVRWNERRRTLLDAAAEVFAESGYEAASVGDIARAAGVSDGLIYRYFADKRALLAGVLERFFEEQIARSEAAAMAQTGFEPRLVALLEAHLSAYTESPELCRLFLNQQRHAGDYRGSPLQALTRRYTDLVLHVVEDGIAAGDIPAEVNARMLRDMIFGGTEHLAWGWLNGGAQIDPKASSKAIAELLVRGCGGR